MLAALRALHQRGAFPRFSDFNDPEGFDRLMQKLASAKRWIVYAKRPFARIDHVLKYLGRYTHRVGISNSRLVDVSAEHVTFRTKNGKTATVTPVEFLRRFVQHVLPDGFHKIRHYGLYADEQHRARVVRAAPRRHRSRRPPLLALRRCDRASARASTHRARATAGGRRVNQSTPHTRTRTRTRWRRLACDRTELITIVATIASRTAAFPARRLRSTPASLPQNRSEPSKCP